MQLNITLTLKQPCWIWFPITNKNKNPIYHVFLYFIWCCSYFNLKALKNICNEQNQAVAHTANVTEFSFLVILTTQSTRVTFMLIRGQMRIRCQGHIDMWGNWFQTCKFWLARRRLFPPSHCYQQILSLHFIKIQAKHHLMVCQGGKKAVPLPAVTHMVTTITECLPYKKAPSQRII